MERHKRTKSEKEYVNAIIQNLSLQRLTDKEIVDYLHKEKHIDIARSTVTNIRNRIEKQAERWYLELRNSAYKYIAVYKERIDSLFRYQRILHDIIGSSKKPEVKIRAISELHSIEMSIFSLWKQLPNLDMVDLHIQQQEDGYENRQAPPVDEKEERERFDKWTEEGRPLSEQYRAQMVAKYGVTIEPWDQPSWLRCPHCWRWFKNNSILAGHTCIKPEEPIV